MTSERTEPFEAGLVDVPRSDLAGLVDAMLRDNADPILLLDDDGTVLFANPAAERALGRGDLEGSPFGFPVAGAEPAELDVVVEGRQCVFEMHVNATILRGRQVKVATLRDVTQRKRTEESLRGFVSTASHEFQTPLASIRTVVDILLGESGPEDRFREELELLGRQAQRLLRLADDLLTLSRLDVGSRTPKQEVVALRESLRQAIRLNADTEEFELAVPDAAAVSCDPDHLQRMVGNYVTNAIKYGAPPFRVACEVNDSHAVIRVTDGGGGVPRSFQPRLFERFARHRSGASSPGGTGLGLAIVAELAVLNGGEAWYEDGRGAAFCLSVPLA
ncbi:MAG: PAS domain-containing sensor histidine kinase [Nitriliruptorales bacterium]|nr:PAS domain-containing sensor histidine kinase [Nitriliruptorales bacterium]